MSDSPAGPPLPPDLACHEPDLLRWATCQVPPWLRPHLDPADLVQTTLLDAWRGWERLAGRPDHEVRGYLLRALANNLIDAVRKFGPARGDVSPDALAASSMRMAEWVAADHTSPSERADRNERFAHLAAALAGLPDSQRLAVEMRYLLGMKVTEIAHALSRSEGAVSLLLHRAIAALRGTLTEPGDHP
jgi:RNA polymerase sigma-70 factor, ECF subfamily